MRRLTVFAIASMLAVSAAARADAPVPAALEVLGSVSSAARPVANALVIALNLKDLDAIQTFTTSDGSFSLPPLRTGIYKLIAVKQGFAPAIATVLPTKASHNVKLSLDREKAAKKSTTGDEMWQIRASLPPDILRELDDTLAQPKEVAYDLPRLRGEMVSMSGVSDQTSASSGIAQTSIGLLSRLGESWQLGFRGNVHRIDDPTDSQRFGDAAAQSSVMSMELRSSPTDSYRVASTKSFWRYRDVEPYEQADVTSHDVQWEHGSTRVGVHYFAQENLFKTNRESDLIEISGGTTLLQSRRGDIGLVMRVTQESVRSAATPIMRTADVTATGTFNAASALLLRYGMTSRVGIDGTELAPRTGAELKIGKNTALVVSGMYKVVDPTRSGNVPPSVVTWTDDGRVLPRYVYSFGIMNGEENGSHVSAIATVSAIETPFRLIFPDVQQQFWDGFFIDSGDVRRDLRLSARRDLGNKLAIDISTSAGTATPTHATNHTTKAYATADLQSVFFPTGTSLIVSYMGIQQPQDRGDYKSERVNVRMAQSLHLPLDLKLLLGVEVVKAENSPYLLDVVETNSTGSTRRYLGGLALNF